ncbi:MAG: radical SAM protein [Elusimicrobia bacterium]|nr:radical SAM protein [Elusimicrobiota bacterium]
MLRNLPRNYLPVEEQHEHPVIYQEAKDINKAAQRLQSLIQSLRTKKHIALTVEVCSLCNLHCRFCDLHSGRLKDVENQKGLMREELYQAILKNIANLGYKLKVIHFQGNGEPLLHRNFPEMARMACDMGISERYVLATNGTLMNEGVFDRLLSSGLNEIHVSLDTADPAKYLKVKGKDLSRKVIANIDYAIRRISTQRHLKLFIKIPVPTPEGDYGLTDADAKNAIQRFAKVEAPNVEIKLMPLALQNDGLLLKRKGHTQPCEQVFYMAYIKFDGRVSICCVDIHDDLHIGRLPDQSLSEILTGDALRNIRQTHIEGRVKGIPLCYYCGSRTAVDLSSHADEIRKYI